LTESSQAGQGFLPRLCVAWEAHDLASLVERVVTLRFGMVLGLTGGALPRLLGVYAKGLGAVLGSGRQWVSWIHIEDVIAMIFTAIADPRWKGAFNCTAPEPCRFKDFNAMLAKKGRYKANKRMPGPLLRLAMGKRAALVLDSTRVVPAAAVQLGFKFKFGTSETALMHLVGDAVGMGMRRFVARQWVPQAPMDVWPFFTEADNLTRLTPDWLGFKVESMSTPTISEGSRINYTISLHGMPMKWETIIKDWQPGKIFIDEQIRGPYDVWYHRHRFEALAGGTLMTDDVQYRLPLSPVGELAAGFLVARDVARIFDFRRRAIASIWGR
jgi:ligand-binding SRPBCC domain-containing protein